MNDTPDRFTAHLRDDGLVEWRDGVGNPTTAEPEVALTLGIAICRVATLGIHRARIARERAAAEQRAADGVREGA